MTQNPSFKTNEFNRPKMLSPMQSYINDILMVLFGEPGFYPSVPELGLNVKQYLYKFEDEIDTDEIKTKLANQCTDFLPQVQSGDLDVVLTHYDDKPCLLFILPIIDDIKSYNVVLGISTNKRGEMVYNFVENKYQLL